MDPFSINDRRMKIDDSIPSLEWGFSKTTCRVKINNAAKAAYKITTSKNRVFYRVDNISQAVAHYVFTDNGCSLICGLKADGGWIPAAVATSIHSYIKTIKTGYFKKSNFELPGQGEEKFELFVNAEDPNAKSKSAL